METETFKTRKITEQNQKDFFDNCWVGMVFRYSSSLSPQEIRDISKKKDIITEYCKPGSAEYKANGCYTMKVIDIIPDVEKHF